MSSDKLNEEGIFIMDMQTLGISPIKVAAETGIHLCAKSGCSDNKFNYGYNGSNYKSIPDQDPDFTIEESNHNSNNTCMNHGQFAHILYSK